MNKQTSGDKYNEILEELHDAFWERDSYNIPYEFPPEALRNASKIFMVVMMDRLWERIKASDMDMEIAGKMAEDCGKGFREFIKKYTFVDVSDYYKK